MADLTQYLAFWTPGPMEMIIIAIIALLVFGKRLPEIARGLGKSLTEFKRGVNEIQEDTDDFAKNAKNFSNDINQQAEQAAKKKPAPEEQGSQQGGESSQSEQKQ